MPLSYIESTVEGDVLIASMKGRNDYSEEKLQTWKTVNLSFKIVFLTV